MNRSHSPAHHPLLISIDAYPNTVTGAKNSLEGCVRDVQIMKKLLNSIRGPSVQTCVLTASLDMQSTRTQLAGGSDSWPTHNNVVEAMKRIAEHAKEGDFVYLHFSGHGTTFRAPHEDKLKTHSNPSTGDLALVLLQQHVLGVEYLRPYMLACLLKSMTDKKLIATFVLDCCFSGNLMRDDTSVRYLKYDPQISPAHPPEPELVSGAEIGDRFSIYRGALVRRNWLVDPDGYTTITACGPTEKAKELRFDDDYSKHGALSYFLAGIFADFGGVGGKIRYLHQLLRVRFQSTRKLAHKQTPMCYGNKQHDFFGHSNSRIGPAPISIVMLEDKRFQIQVGEAHDVREHDTFVVSSYAVGTRNKTGAASFENYCTAEVVSVGPLASIVRLSATNIPQGLLMAGTELTRLSLREIPICLEPGLPSPELWKAAVHDQTTLDIYHAQEVDREHVCLFSVALSQSKHYEIRDEKNHLIWEHHLAADESEDDVALLLQTLEHLAKFESVKRLTNRSSTAYTDLSGRTLSARLTGPDMRAIKPGCLMTGHFQTVCSHPECVTEVDEGALVKLEVFNHGKTHDPAIFLHPYILGSSWDIVNLNDGSYEVIPPNCSESNFSNQYDEGTTGVWIGEFEMAIPPALKAQGKKQCEDIFKLFITSRATAFQTLELPELHEVLAREDPVRYRGPSEKLVAEDWIVLVFRVRTRME